MSSVLWLDEPAPVYGPLPGDESVDVAIVGGGVTGLSCARVLAEAGASVRVLEARRVGSGASGRNGGFALRGLARGYTELRDPELMRLTEEGVDRMAELAGDAFRRTGSLSLAADEAELPVIEAEYEALAEDGFAAEWLDRGDLPPPLDSVYLGALRHPGDGVLEPGRWARGLAVDAAEAGAAIAEETRALALTDTAVRTDRGTVSATQVVLAMDGYARGLVPELDALLAPARNQVLATAPLGERLFEGALYARYGYDYWQQTVEGRIVLGGRRDADLDAEATDVEGTTATVQRELERLLAQLLTGVPEITHRWSGLLAFTPDRLPLVGDLPGREGVCVSLGYSGHGNVLALVCGEAVGHAILGRADPRLDAFSPGRFPAVRPRA